MVDNRPKRQFEPILATNLTIKKRLKTGIPNIDKQLNGGLPTNGIIELCGESGSGKSQLCLQLSLMAQLEGQQASVIYICTEDTFPSKRLQQMIPAFSKKLNGPDFGSNIFVEHAADYAILKDCLTERVPRLLKHRKVSLLIIDSVAALFRGTYTTGQGGLRTKDLRTLGETLLKLNVQFGITIICVNQVTACCATDTLVPSLGLAWANMITTRIQLHRHKRAMRRLQVVFSPVVPKSQYSFQITQNGLEDCEIVT